MIQSTSESPIWDRPLQGIGPERTPFDGGNVMFRKNKDEEIRSTGSPCAAIESLRQALEVLFGRHVRYETFEVRMTPLEGPIGEERRKVSLVARVAIPIKGEEFSSSVHVRARVRASFELQHGPHQSWRIENVATIIINEKLHLARWDYSPKGDPSLGMVIIIEGGSTSTLRGKKAGFSRDDRID